MPNEMVGPFRRQGCTHRAPMQRRSTTCCARASTARTRCVRVSPAPVDEMRRPTRLMTDNECLLCHIAQRLRVLGSIEESSNRGGSRSC